jgi:hypothetical protein
MSVVAIALAKDSGLDIVTDSGRTHYALANLDEEAVLASLISPHDASVRPPADRTTELTDELAQVVLTIGFDVSRLSTPEVIALARDAKGLHAFKMKISEIASQIPEIPNAAERARRLKQAAEGILEEWAYGTGGLKDFVKETAIAGFEKTLPSQLEKLAGALLTDVRGSAAAAAASSAVTTTALGAAAGLGVGLITFAGFALLRRYLKSDPHRYLTSIHRAGATLLLTTPA